MMRRALEATRDDRAAGLVLGIDHPLARAIDACEATKRQCVVVAAIAVGCIRPAAEGHTWGVALGAAAAVTLAVLALILAGCRTALRDRANELISHGQDTLAVGAVQAQRRRLLRRRTHLTLARCLEDLVRQASAPRSRQLRPAPPLLDYRMIQSVSGQIRSIARLLRGGRCAAPGLARAEWLVTHARSPLYGHEAHPLQIELQHVAQLLAGPLPTALANNQPSAIRGGDMSESSLVDHPDAQILVTQARDRLAAGKDKEAARLLTDAAYHTHDPGIEQQVRELAAEGLERSGRFGKGRWEEIIRIADLRAQGA